MKTNYRITPSFFKVCLALLFCSTYVPNALADMSEMTRVFKQTPYLEEFEICHAGGCTKVSQTSIELEEWQQVANLFEPAPENAEQERAVIKQAIGAIEHIVGAKTGTDTDRGGTFDNSDFKGQMDCNDEATNTTTYIKLLIHDDLVRFHKVLDTKTRKFFFNGWPHSTAVIQETATGEQYAVDSWFYDNGQPAEIVPLKQWLDGWKPNNTKAH
jgi:hypothetical protein